MKIIELTEEQIAFLSESLTYSQRHVEEWHSAQPHQFYETGRQRCAEVKEQCKNIKAAFKTARTI